jgi:enterochelin esterase family protein
MIAPLYATQQIDALRRVTFRLQAPQATSVSIEFGKPEGAACGERVYSLTRGNDGAWTVTTEPVRPGFHYYSVIVDGFHCSDPSAACYFGWGHWCSGIDIPDPDFPLAEPAETAHGEVRMHWYHSSICRSVRRCLVYTPPGYDTAADRYPVLYLQHGSGEAEFSWVGQGRANHILDNLLAAGKALPMLVVMDKGYAHPPGSSVDNRADNRFAEVASQELVPDIDRSFRSVADRRHRAIAGLSMGAGQAMQIGLGRLDLFASVAAMSGGGRSFDPATSYGGLFSDAAGANGKLDLLWLGCGRQDGGFEGARAMHDQLQASGVRHVWYESEGSHDWGVWRRQLAHLAERLFVKKA